MWDLEMLHVLKQPGINFDRAVVLLEWVFSDPFWSSRMHIAKHFAENIDAIRDAYDAAQRAAKLTEKIEKKCLCIRNDEGLVISDAQGPIYDYDCPLHGKDSQTHIRCRMQGGKMIVVPTYQGRPPRKGEPGFEDHLAAMRAVLEQFRRPTPRLVMDIEEK
jgi:hypothetical protein